MFAPEAGVRDVRGFSFPDPDLSDSLKRRR